MIFFVSWIADAMILKEDIGRWLRERDRIVKSFHGDLSPESKVDIPKFQSSLYDRIRHRRRAEGT